MTAAPVTATCTAQVTDPTNTWACTSHLGIYHVADTGDGGLRLWIDPDDCGFAPWEAPMIAQLRSELGTPPAQRPDPVAVVLDRVADLAHRLRGRPSSIREINAVIAAHDALTGGGA